ncbi:hypothetical protein ZEAMMB73_Zm00001d034105 [Zea mays]|uniref:Uncharacterized protein n=1 Tax=Zea mays TaxID=4577 RepID=A0A1D6L5I1_MAIZE|nr:hypothetical protein ZEAMMB73_Zm00001d034105 [Zea mays]
MDGICIVSLGDSLPSSRARSVPSIPYAIHSIPKSTPFPSEIQGIFRKEPFFYGHDNHDQLVKIAKQSPSALGGLDECAQEHLQKPELVTMLAELPSGILGGGPI